LPTRQPVVVLKKVEQGLVLLLCLVTAFLPSNSARLCVFRCSFVWVASPVRSLIECILPSFYFKCREAISYLPTGSCSQDLLSADVCDEKFGRSWNVIGFLPLTAKTMVRFSFRQPIVTWHSSADACRLTSCDSDSQKDSRLTNWRLDLRLYSYYGMRFIMLNSRRGLPSWRKIGLSPASESELLPFFWVLDVPHPLMLCRFSVDVFCFVPVLPFERALFLNYIYIISRLYSF